MPIPSIVPPPVRDFDVEARFPVPYRALGIGDSPLVQAHSISARGGQGRLPVNVGDLTPFSNGSSGGTGVSVGYQIPGLAGEIPACLEQTSTAGVGWAHSFTWPWLEIIPGLGAGILGGTPFPAATRVYWWRWWCSWAQNPDINTDGGIYFVGYNGTTAGGVTRLPGGSAASLTAFGMEGFNNAGQSGVRFRFYDPAGAVTRTEEVPLSVLASATPWWYADWVLINGSAGRPANLTCSVRGTEILSQDMDNAVFFSPRNFNAGGAYVGVYSFSAHIGGQGTSSAAIRTRYEMRSGKYLPDGREILS